MTMPHELLFRCRVCKSIWKDNEDETISFLESGHCPKCCDMEPSIVYREEIPGLCDLLYQTVQLDRDNNCRSALAAAGIDPNTLLKTKIIATQEEQILFDAVVKLCNLVISLSREQDIILPEIAGGKT